MRDELANAMAAPHMSDRHADDAERPSGSGSHDDEKALQELRSLLISEEQHEIVALRERIESPEQRALDVSAVVAEAIELRRAQGGDQKLSAALTPTVEEALRESVRKDSHVLVEALFPVMGPAIRRSVAEVFSLDGRVVQPGVGKHVFDPRIAVAAGSDADRRGRTPRWRCCTAWSTESNRFS